MTTSRDIADLHPDVATLAIQFKAEAAKQGIDVLIYCTLRDNTTQAELYAKGRTTAGPIVTNARPGESAHNYGCAWDCVPIVQGKAMWNDDATYTKLGRIGEGLGLEWAGRWTGKLKEKAHFQLAGWKTIRAKIRQ